MFAIERLRCPHLEQFHMLFSNANDKEKAMIEESIINVAHPAIFGLQSVDRKWNSSVVMMPRFTVLSVGF